MGKTKIPFLKSFEDCIQEINVEINKRRNKWCLTALAWLDFEDVAQILRIHIYRKWDLYDQNRPLGPWINRVISSQIKNLIRNHYSNFSRPCLRCDASEPDELCVIFTKQCPDCPLYRQWLSTKKNAYDTKLPLPLENHLQEVFNRAEDTIDIERSAANLHNRMQTVLKPAEWRVYRALYIEHKTEEETAKMMGFRTSEKNRSPGYKQIRNIKKAIIIKVRKCFANNEVDIV